MDWLIQLAAIVTALGTLGGALIWGYNKAIAEPDRKVEERVQKNSNDALKESVSPLTNEIKKLNYLLEESQKDRAQLHQKDGEQDVVLDDHETRLSILEDWRKRRNN